MKFCSFHSHTNSEHYTTYHSVFLNHLSFSESFRAFAVRDLFFRFWPFRLSPLGLSLVLRSFMPFAV